MAATPPASTVVQLFSTPLTFQSLSRSVLHFMIYGLHNAHFSLVGSVLLLGLFTANYSMIILFIGMAVLTPLVIYFITHLLGITAKQNNYYYLGILSFFIGYVIANAVVLYDLPVSYPPNADDAMKKQVDSGVSNRKSQALTSMLVIVFLTLIIMYIQFTNEQVNFLAVIGFFVVFSLFGYGWFAGFDKTGSERLTDIFGIANRLLNGDAIANQPFACIREDK